MGADRIRDRDRLGGAAGRALDEREPLAVGRPADARQDVARELAGPPAEKGHAPEIEGGGPGLARGVVDERAVRRHCHCADVARRRKRHELDDTVARDLTDPHAHPTVARACERDEPAVGRHAGGPQVGDRFLHR